MRFLPVEIHVQQGDALQMVCEHNAHDLNRIRLYGVTDEMLAPPGGIGHPEWVDNDKVMDLGVSMSRDKYRKGAK